MSATALADSFHEPFPVPTESDELRLSLFAAISDDPENASAFVAKQLSLKLADAWHEELEHRGVSPEALHIQVVSYYREIFLWIMGDRTWQQTIEGLGGRIERRFPLR